jgi:hypothetical protein
MRESTDNAHWTVGHMFATAPATLYVGRWLESFREFLPRQQPASYNLDRAMEAMIKGQPSK